MARDFTEHHCLVVFAQDTWRAKDKERIGTDVKARFLQLGGHSDCKTCGSCPICRSLEALFDPTAPGPYDMPCGTCKPLQSRLKALLGKNDGFILFSHNRPIDGDLVSVVMKDKRVKKVYVLSLMTSKVHGITEKGLKDLRVTTSTLKEFLKGTPEDNVIHEVRKDEHS